MLDGEIKRYKETSYAVADISVREDTDGNVDSNVDADVKAEGD